MKQIVLLDLNESFYSNLGDRGNYYLNKWYYYQINQYNIEPYMCENNCRN